MRSVIDHIDRVKAQPHHVRHAVALVSAGLITAFIALAWVGVSLSTGAFAIAGDGFTQATGAAPPNVHGKPAPDSAGLAGAAGAPAAGQAHMDIVPNGTSPSAPAQNASAPASPAIIPF